MTAQFRDFAAPAGANSTTRTITIPSTVQIGDLMIMQWIDAGTDANPNTPPSGWTLLGDTDSTNASTMSITVYSKVAVSGDPGSTITLTADAIRRHGIAMTAYYDNAGATLSVESAVFAASLTTPAATTVAPNCFVVTGAGVRGGGADPFTSVPSGYTSRLEQSTDTASGGKTWNQADKLTSVPAGTAVGGLVWANADPTGPASWLVIVKPTGGANTTNFFQFM